MHGFFLPLASPILDKVSGCLSPHNYKMLGQDLTSYSEWLGLQKQSGDARAFSFLRILELMPDLLQPPAILFVENVVGFEVCFFIGFVFALRQFMQKVICLHFTFLFCRRRILMKKWLRYWLELALPPKSLFWAHYTLGSHIPGHGISAWYSLSLAHPLSQWIKDPLRLPVFVSPIACHYPFSEIWSCMLLHLKIPVPCCYVLMYSTYLQAKRKPLSFQRIWLNSKLLWSPSPLVGQDHNPSNNDDSLQQRDNCNNYVEACLPIELFLECNEDVNRECCLQDVTVVFPETTDTSIENDARVRYSVSPEDQYLVPSSLIERWGNAMGMLFVSCLSNYSFVNDWCQLTKLLVLINLLWVSDIVYPDSRRCCCFTKSYYRYVKGTGSLLATIEVSFTLLTHPFTRCHCPL